MVESLKPVFQAGFIDGSPDVAMAIGLFVARWSLAEMPLIMPMLLATKSSQEVCASMLASTNSTEGKIKLARSAVAHSVTIVSDAEKSAIDKVLRDFVSACPIRNDMMHHLWGRRTDGLVCTIDYRKKVDDDRLRGRTAVTIFDACNTALDIAYRLCKVTGSPFVNEEAVRLLTLPPS